MKDKDISAVLAQEGKTKKQLINELKELRQRIAELEKSETTRKKAQEKLRKYCEHLEEVVERHKRAEGTFRKMAYHDPLTNLPNRRGFTILAQLQHKIAHRKKESMLLLFADFDDLKSINDNLGHHEGDQALIETSNLLRKTFRGSDIIARIGGDEFVVLAIENSNECSEILTNHLKENLRAHNMNGNSPYKLSLSVGTVRYNSQYPYSIDEMLDKADKLMYEQKRVNHKF